MPTNPAALAWALVLGHEARVSGDDEREVREMAESNFHGRMMNIRCVSAMAGDVTAYKEGHRDARHAAAEIANEADQRIAELEAQLAAAQERERAATLRGNWYEQWIEDTTLEDYREQGEFEDDAKRMTERNMQSRRERMAEYVAAALAAAQQGEGKPWE